MSTEIQSDQNVVDDEYGTEDPILDPSASEDDLIAAQEASVNDAEYDDTPGTVQVAGVTTDDDDAGQEPEPGLQQPVRNKAALDAAQKSSSADANPVDEEATASGNGPDDDQDGVEWDAALLQAAGLEESEARAQFDSPEALENAVRLWDLRAVKWAQEQEEAASRQFSEQPDPAQQQPPQQPQRREVEEQTPDLIDEEELELPELPDGEEWDDETVAVVQSLANHFNAKFQAAVEQMEAKFRGELEQTSQITQAWLEQQAQETLANYVAEFDGFVNELGDEWTDILGKGDGYKLPQDSQELQNRVHLDTVSRQLQQGREANGLPPLSRRQLLDRALRVAFPQNQEKVLRKQIEGDVAKRQKLKTNRPGNTVRRQSTPEEQAISHVEKWYQDRGLTPTMGDEFEYDEI